MQLSIFLAKLFGAYLVVMGIFWMTKEDRLQKVPLNLFTSPALLTITGAYSLLFGLFILMLHPIFEWSFRGVITLVFGIYPIIRGLTRLFLVEKASEYSKLCTKGKKRMGIGVALIIIGAFLIYNGFLG